MIRRHRRVLATVAIALVTGACSSGSDGKDSAASRSAPTTVTTLPPDTVFVAQGKGPKIPVFNSPDDPALALELANPDEAGAPRVFVVRSQRGEWYEVLLPVRPPAIGWVRAADIEGVTRHDYRVKVELGAHRITVTKAGQPILEEAVGVNRATAPPPNADYFIGDILTVDPKARVGPVAYVLSGYSDLIKGGAAVAIHGTADPATLGKDTKDGSIRMSVEGITKLSTQLPLGTPVVIVA